MIIFHDLLAPQFAHAKTPLHVHQNIAGNITFYVGPECYFCQGIFSFSMTFDIFKNFCDFSTPGLEISHSNSMTY